MSLILLRAATVAFLAYVVALGACSAPPPPALECENGPGGTLANGCMDLHCTCQQSARFCDHRENEGQLCCDAHDGRIDIGVCVTGACVVNSCVGAPEDQGSAGSAGSASAGGAAAGSAGAGGASGP